MKVLVALTYYRPHVSGLTIYAERLARGLASRGHAVTVLTSQHDPALPRRETIDGVRVVRVPVAFHLSKGVVMPGHGRSARHLLREHDVVSVHLPQLEAWSLAMRARRLGKPCILTYHCDLRLPPGAVNRVAQRVVVGANVFAGACAERIVAYTADYAAHSPFLRRFARKVVVVPPPVSMPRPSPAEVDAFRRAHELGGADGGAWPVLGFAARLAAEKGVETLLEAIPALHSRFPRLKVLFAGPSDGIVGEERYRERLAPRLAALGRSWEFLGTLHPVEEMPAFYGALDCLLVPSLNSTESFGLVQVEAMLCGTPVVASNLPGVREPVRLTGMGEIVPTRDPRALADAVTRLVDERPAYVRPRDGVAALFDPERTLDAYEALFEEVRAS